MSKASANIEIKLSDKFPENFTPTYDDFEVRGLGFFKIDDKPEKANFPLSPKKENWNFEIVYDDYKCTAGKLIAPLHPGQMLDVPEKKNITSVSIYFIFSKLPVLKETTPLRWATYFYPMMSKKQIDSIERYLRANRGTIFEKVKQHKEFLRRMQSNLEDIK